MDMVNYIYTCYIMSIPLKKIKNIIKFKEQLSLEQKRRLLIGLKKIKEEYTGNIGGETDITNADNLVSEDDITSERNAIAKEFDTESDFDSYVNQHRGIQMTPKEQEAIIGYKSAKPTQQDKFFVKFEKSDSFGTNDTTVIKKMKDGNKFCWTAFSKSENLKSSPEKAPSLKEQSPN